MHQARVDADAEVHPPDQRPGRHQRHAGGMIVHVRRDPRRQEPHQGAVRGDVGAAAAEKDLAALRRDHPGHELDPAGERPVTVRIGRDRREEHPPPAPRRAVDQRGGQGRGLRGDPVLVVIVVDGDAVGREQVEGQFHLVAAAAEGHRPREERPAAVRRVADPVGDAGQPRQQGRRERPLEQVGPRVAAAPQPGRLGADVHERRQRAAALGGPGPGDDVVHVGTAGEGVAGGPGHADVDRGVGAGTPQVPQERNRQERVAQVATADDEDAFGALDAAPTRRDVHGAESSRRPGRVAAPFGG